MRALLLHLLPKVLFSRATGALCSLPLPRALRTPFFSWFARRYGADLAQIGDPLDSYRSMQAFFQRALREGARPVGNAPLVWPSDGRIVTSGPVRNGRIEQVKGRDYALADLLGDRDLAAAARAAKKGALRMRGILSFHITNK